MGQQKIKVQKSWVNKIVGPEDMGLGDMGQNVSPKKLGKKKFGSSKIWVKINVGPKNVVP